MKLFERLFGRIGAQSQPKPTRTRLYLEPLETRLVPAPIMVNTLADDPGGRVVGQETFRDAINDANTTPGSTITFQAGLTGGINVGVELPHIQQDVTINAPDWVNGHPVITLNGNNQFRGLTIDQTATTVAITNLGIANFSVIGNGGGISCDAATLDLTDVYISHCSSDADGGGLYTWRALNMDGCVIDSCIANNGGGWYQLSGTANVGTTLFSNNTAHNSPGGDGGGASLNGGTVNLNAGDVFDSNHAINGGGLYTSNPSTVTLYGTVIKNNTASNDGGGMFNESANVTCKADAAGVRTKFTGNSALYGGGLWLDKFGTTDFAGTDISGNSVLPGGAGTGYYYIVGATIFTPDLNNTDTVAHN